jgi:hypothetical protein
MSPPSGRSLLIITSLLLGVILVTHRIGKGEFDYNVDESQHAATGLFVKGFLQDLPLKHPVAYTYRSYAQYPALSGVLHWPPLFYAAEGVVFLALGPSVVTARLTVLLFAMIFWFFWFLWCSEILAPKAAFWSTMMLATLPAILLFEKSVMLEIPCLALSVAALYYWHRYLMEESRRDLYLFTFFLAAALLTKQSSIFIPLACVFTTALLRKWPLIWSRRSLPPLAILLAAVGPFYALVYVVHWKTIAMDLLYQHNSGGGGPQGGQWRDAILFYVKALPGQLGWPLLMLAAAGIASYRRWSRWEPAAFMLSWIAAGYMVFTAIQHKEPRYAIYCLPPFIYFAGGFLANPWKLRPTRILAGVLAAAMLGQAILVAWKYQRPYEEGYAALASNIHSLSNSGVILFEAPLPANFIFFLRRLDEKRSFVVLRKALRVMRIKVSGGSVELARTVDEVNGVIDQNGVKYVVVSDGAPEFEGQRSLQTLLKSDSRFEFLGSFALESNEREFRNLHLLLYRNNKPTLPTDRFLRIRMMTLSHDIVVPWEELNQPVSNQAITLKSPQ